MISNKNPITGLADHFSTQFSYNELLKKMVTNLPITTYFLMLTTNLAMEKYTIATMKFEAY